MAVRLRFIIYDKYKCYPEHRKDEDSRIAYIEYHSFLTTFTGLV